MTARVLTSFICRRRTQFSSLCDRVSPLAVGSLGDTCQPLTSAPAHEQAADQVIRLWTRRFGPNLSCSGWRSVHHDHQQCGDKNNLHCNERQHEGQGASRRHLTLEEMEKACWSCDKLVKRGGLVCNGCETIQPPDETLNYFELFSLPETSFDINPRLLERRYKQLHWNVHPDKMGQKPTEEREFSAQQASIINLGYSILKSPLSRANYLLALRGISAGDSFEGTLEDPELLVEVMEAREEVEDTDDPTALSALLVRNRQQQAGLVAELSAAFRADDMKAAVALTNQLQYVAKLEQEIIKKLPQL
ncbi:hypothetical protein VaNZ11_000889 [Volvox africanus]|uniref:J domain-containing protein n=1 Tax=Volvox africanus TaxID=51714 RepID=A0ABQ5RP27_9CHLO|nr:hypothetical protein VaNZ11_000889 [Volvox africanus]